MTYNNGTVTEKHQEITDKTGMKIYFSHPYSSRGIGTNKNTNGIIRRRLPKGTDSNLIDLNKHLQIQEKLNNRSRKIISFKTPKEIIRI